MIEIEVLDALKVVEADHLYLAEAAGLDCHFDILWSRSADVVAPPAVEEAKEARHCRAS